MQRSVLPNAVLIRWPDHIQAGVTTDDLIGLTDVLATLADGCGAPLPEAAAPDSGSRLASLLQDKDNIEERPVLVTACHSGVLTNVIAHNPQIAKLEFKQIKKRRVSQA